MLLVVMNACTNFSGKAWNPSGILCSVPDSSKLPLY